MADMKKPNDLDKFRALFLLAYIPIIREYELPNGYWPEHDDYLKIRAENPWLLVITEIGPIKLGWRKRVISISWEDCEVRSIVTEDDVTKSETGVHAYSYLKALEYLIALKQQHGQMMYLRNNPPAEKST